MAIRKRPAHSQHSLSQDHEYNNDNDNDNSNGDTAVLEQLDQEHEAPRRKRARKTQQLEQDTDALPEDADDHNRHRQRQDHEGSDHEYHQGDQQEEEEDDEDVDEDHLLAAMTQQVEREDRRRRNDADKVAEKGVLEEVDLVNVMCHKRLSIKLNSRINFIIGHNGSGKSAILTAITICLGGRARETNRATNLRSLINDKSDTASVSVKIKNRGEDAYKPETYGPSIIVERKFTRAGSSSYYIRDHTGHTVTNRREELDNILDHMNIQIDNPMSVLTQDQARMFLNSSTPEDKYKAFDRGTNLAQLSESYTQVLDMTNAISRMVAQRRQILPDLRQKKNRALEKAKALERAADLEDTVDQLTQEMSWAHVTELEKKRAEAQAQADEELAKVQEADQKVAKNQAQLAAVEEDIANQQTKVKILRTQLQPLIDEKKSLQMEFRATVKTIADIDSNIKDLNDDLATQKKNRDDIEERIETERQKMNTRTADEFERKRREMDRHKEAIQDLERRKESHISEIQDIENRLRDVTRQSDEAHRSVESLQSQKADMNRDIQNMENGRGNIMTIWHSTLPAVMRDIERANWREQKPVLIGQHVKVLEKEPWSPILEYIIGPRMKDFIVFCHEDSAQLSKILSRNKAERCEIFNSSDDPIPWQKGDPGQQFKTLMRIVKITHPAVLRVLVTATHLEGIIMYETRQEAESVVYRGYPKNVTNCMIVPGYSVGSKLGGKSMRAFKVDKHRPSSFADDVESQIRQARQQLQRVHNEIENAQTAAQKLSQEKRRLQSSKSELESAIVKCDREIRTHRGSIAGLEEEQRQDESVTIAALEEEKQVIESRIGMIQSQFAAVIQNKNNVTARQLELKTKGSECTTLITAKQEEVNDAEAKLAPLQQEAADARRTMDWFGNKHREHSAKYDDYLRQVNTYDRIVAEEIAKAQQIHPERIITNANPQTLSKRIQNLRQQIEQHQRAQGITLEEALAAAERTDEEYKTAKQDVKDMRALTKQLRTAIEIRIDKLRTFRKLIATRARLSFSMNLLKRGYTGSIRFDHKAKTLDIKVNVEDNDGDTNKQRNIKTLSGGEKSFSTICLLLSLWEAMGCPIRCLDEFDVFMDQVNRKVSMNMLIGAAEDAHQVQFILITPQNMSNVNLNSNKISVHKLRDPSRNQTQLNFTQEGSSR